MEGGKGAQKNGSELEIGDGVLVFAVNGVKFEVPSVDPSTTLLEFLRCQTPFKSVKLGCGEGGCGACVVMVSKYDPVLDEVEDFTLSSCLTLLCSMNGCSITTTEGLGNSKDGFHPIHQRFAGFHASQCGFCTPGMCMSFFSALKNSEKSQRPEPALGFSKLTTTEAEKAIAGNLCRCTGYRPISDACKSFASNVDLEDLGLNAFWKIKEPKEFKSRKLPSYDPSLCVNEFPEFLKCRFKPALKLDSNNYCWYSPTSLDELRSLLNSNSADDGSKIKLLVGNIGSGYYEELQLYDKFIDLRHIPELSLVRRNYEGIALGAAVSIARVISCLKEKDDAISSPGSRLIFQKIADHMEKIGSGFVRNSASIGGNLVMAQRKSFPSDIATLLLAVDCTVSIETCGKHEVVTLEDFLGREPLDSRSVLLSVQIPIPEPKRKDNIIVSDSTLYFEAYRAAPRPLGNALPYLNATFMTDVSPCVNGGIINDIKLAFGAYGTKNAIRARKVEQHLLGKLLTVNVLREAVELVKAEVVPVSGTSHVAYRTSLAVSFLFQFLSQFLDVGFPIKDGLLNGIPSTLSDSQSKRRSALSIGQMESSTLLLPAKQEMNSNRDYYPVEEPIVKTAAAIQASVGHPPPVYMVELEPKKEQNKPSHVRIFTLVNCAGEAVYVNDIPSPPNCLYGAFIYSTKPLARVKGLDFKPGSQLSGVSAVITYKDVPEVGENVGSKTFFGFDPLFADEITRGAGELIAFVLAETQKAADIAAISAVVSYETENLDPPILSVEEAVEKSSFFDVPPFLYPKDIGDFSKGMAEADHKLISAEIKLGSQYYFYMEPQTALAVPDEDNCMVVYSSTQSPEWAHNVIAKCLGVPEHNVRVITRRVGGGFGGKATKATPVATACALAAQKLRRPVRTYLNRKTDMITSGGRHPMKITYSVGFKSNGKVTALHLNILIDAGMYVDLSPMMPSTITNPLKKYNWGALSFDIKVCKTNHSNKSAMRCPGEMQGSFIAEAIIESIASELSMEVDAVRNINLHTFESLGAFYGRAVGEAPDYTLPDLWDKLEQSARLAQRMEMIEQFNRGSIWQKRGISRIPIVYEVSLRPTPGKVSILCDGSIVVEVGGVDLGQGLWTKVKQVTAYALSSVGCDGTENLAERIRVVQSDTLSLVQAGITAGSTTSESSCEAVRLCCNTLVERLSQLNRELQEQISPVNWDSLILQAHSRAVNMAAHSYYVPDSDTMEYLNYGAAVSEVEINILTGETSILRTDIIYDCGQSMNPAVDLGQIEGAFVQGVGFFMLEECLVNEDGLMISDSTWTYKIPTIDTIPKQFNVGMLSTGHHKKRVLSSKASGEPPLLLAASVHCAIRAAIKEARKQLKTWGKLDGTDSSFRMDVPAVMPVVKSLCGLDCVELCLESLLTDS